MTTADQVTAGAAGTVAIGDLTVPRFGFGAMRLTGPHIFGPPADREECVRVVRAAYDAGVRVFDTSWYYGPDVSNEIVREALSPYPDDVVLVAKLGGARTSRGGWIPALSDAKLREGNERDLRTLGIEALPVTHLRWMGEEASPGVSFEDALETMIKLQEAGRIQRIGLSTVTPEQLDTALEMTEIVTVSNAFGPLNRVDQAMLARCEELGIAYLPYFPLSVDAMNFGTASADETLSSVGAEIGASAVQVALAWLLQRSDVMLPIPGTSTTAHLAENVASAAIKLSAEQLARLGA